MTYTSFKKLPNMEPKTVQHVQQELTPDSVVRGRVINTRYLANAEKKALYKKMKDVITRPNRAKKRITELFAYTVGKNGQQRLPIMLDSPEDNVELQTLKTLIRKNLLLIIARRKYICYGYTVRYKTLYGSNQEVDHIKETEWTLLIGQIMFNR